MLVIVPYLVQHPGTTLDEASALFGVEQARLRKDLDLLFMSGLPPYGPGDLIDVEVDEDGAVRLGDFVDGRALTTAVAHGADAALWRGFAGYLAPELVVGGPS